MCSAPRFWSLRSRPVRRLPSQQRWRIECISPIARSLVPGLEEALRLRAPGLLGCALSGAGPSIVVFYERGFEEVCDLVCQIFALHGRKAEVIAAQIAREGYSVQVED